MLSCLSACIHPAQKPLCSFAFHKICHPLLVLEGGGAGVVLEGDVVVLEGGGVCVLEGGGVSLYWREGGCCCTGGRGAIVLEGGVVVVLEGGRVLY